MLESIPFLNGGVTCFSERRYKISTTGIEVIAFFSASEDKEKAAIYATPTIPTTGLAAGLSLFLYFE
jgi:hypothetical protein